MLWRVVGARAIRGCVRSALERGYRSVAFPLIGAGTGGFSPERALEIMQDEARQLITIFTVWLPLLPLRIQRPQLSDGHGGTAEGELEADPAAKIVALCGAERDAGDERFGGGRIRATPREVAAQIAMP